MQRSTNQGQYTINTTCRSPKDIEKKQITSNVCALLNSNGGTLIIRFLEQGYTKKDLDQTLRKIEQWIKTLVGTAMMLNKVSIDELPLNVEKIVINIKGSYNLITVDYNLFLPSFTEINGILPVESLESVKKALFTDEVMKTTDEFPTIQEVFVRKKEIKLTETYSVQFKQLEDAPSRSNTLADRIIGKGNKLLQCISAFATYRGGVIYVGVDDEKHEINGEVIPAYERKSITKKLENKINKMIWLGLEDGPCKGKNWDVQFHPVVESNGTVVESTFVIVIVVARCPGGVFLKEPESYHMVNGAVEKMKLETWKEYLYSQRSHDNNDHCSCAKPKRALQCQRSLGRQQWSSVHIRRKYFRVNGAMIQLINDGSWKELWSLIAKESANCVASVVKMAILSNKITAHYKMGDFKQAQQGLEEFKRKLAEIPQSKDRVISEAREFLVKSALERSRGNVRESYEHAMNGLPLLEEVPSGMFIVQYLANLATTITILLEVENAGETNKKLKKQAIDFFEKAIDHLEDSNDFLPAKYDHIQKIHIHLAFLHLGCSYASGTRDACRVDDSEIKKAANHVNAAAQSVNEGYAMTNYRNCQYLLVRSVLFFRLSQNVQPDEIERRDSLQRSAYKFSNEAKEIAKTSNLYEIVQNTREMK